MELRHLKYFVAVAEELHFARGRASQHLGADAQPSDRRAGSDARRQAVDAQDQERGRPHQHGKRLLIAAREALKQAAYAETVGRHAARGDTGSIAAGYVFSAGCGGLVSSTLDSFRKTHPEPVVMAFIESLRARASRR